jgi:hypothetical protein
MVESLGEEQNEIKDILNEGGKTPPSTYINAGASVIGMILDGILPGLGGVARSLGTVIGKLVDYTQKAEVLHAIDWKLKVAMSRAMLLKYWQSTGGEITDAHRHQIIDGFDIRPYVGYGNQHLMTGSVTYLLEKLSAIPYVPSLEYEDSELLEHTLMPAHGSLIITVPTVDDPDERTVHYVGVGGFEPWYVLIKRITTAGDIVRHTWVEKRSGGHWMPVTHTDATTRVGLKKERALRMSKYDLIVPPEAVLPFITTYMKYAPRYNLYSYNCQHTSVEIVAYLSELRIPAWWTSDMRKEMLNNVFF